MNEKLDILQEICKQKLRATKKFLFNGEHTEEIKNYLQGLIDATDDIIFQIIMLKYK